MHRASVTIVIVNWNGAEHLPQCLAAVQKQTILDFQCVVVDNGSTDGSAQFVHMLQDSRFVLLEMGKNLGFAKANNFAVQRAKKKTSWIALVNPDAFLHPEWLEHMIAATRDCPQVAGLGCTLIDANDRNYLDGTGDAYHFSGRPFRRDHGRLQKLRKRPAGDIFAPCAAAAFYRRSAWIAAGGLDEDYFCYMEDVDLGFRLRLMGYQCKYVPEAKCYHVGSALTGRRSDFSGYYGQRNLVWTYVKNMPGSLFWILLPWHFLANIAALFIFAFRGHFRVAWRAKIDAILGLPLCWKKRQKIQMQRKVSLLSIWQQMDKSLWPGP